jgi:hypothetical protein
MIFFLVQSKGKFLSQFANENLKNQANAVWQSLESITPLLVAIFIVAGVGFAVSYYTVFNNRPGRHYKMKYWFLFAAFALIATLVFTLIAEFGLIKTNLKNDVFFLYSMCALSNVIYSLILYFIISVIWCNLGKTNAYRYFKL